MATNSGSAMNETRIRLVLARLRVSAVRDEAVSGNLEKQPWLPCPVITSQSLKAGFVLTRSKRQMGIGYHGNYRKYGKYTVLDDEHL